jgi:hypothetical protein
MELQERWDAIEWDEDGNVFPIRKARKRKKKGLSSKLTLTD